MILQVGQASWPNANSSDNDAAGNRILPRDGTFGYDAENRVVMVKRAYAASCVYDGEGRRVKKTASGLDTVSVYSGAGELVAEYGGGVPGGGPLRRI